MTGVNRSNRANHPKLRRNDVELFADFLVYSHQHRAAGAALLLFRNIDDHFFTRKGLRQRSALGPLPLMLGNANQLGLPLRAVGLRRGGLRLVEQLQLPLLFHAERFAAPPEEALFQPSILFGKDLNALGKLGELSPQLRVLLCKRLDVPLHAWQPITAQ